jgi:hypothetical protein
MSNRAALFWLALLLVGLLALAISGMVRELVVIPLLYLLWLAGVLVDSLPQALLWIGFLATAVFVAWKSLSVPRARPPLRQIPSPSRAPAMIWTSLFQRAADDRYVRWLLAQRLGQLALELLSSQDQSAARGLWYYLRDETTEMPPSVRAYLQAGTQIYLPAPGRWWRWWPWGTRAEPQRDPLDLDPAEVVQYLEEWLNRTTGAQQ